MRRNNQKALNEKRQNNEHWFQENLKTIRTLTGLTLGDISKNTGISIQTLSLIERGTKALPFYQYIVIRRYIDSYLTDSLRHELYDTSSVEDFAIELVKPILSVAISVIRNDMNIWSQREQNYILEQWELVKEDFSNCEDAKTAKTYSKVFSKSYSNFGIVKFFKALIKFFRAFNSEAENGFSIFESNIDEELDYISFIESIENFSPVDKITSFVLFETALIVLFAIPYDETAALLHVNVTKDNIKQMETQFEELSAPSKQNLEIFESVIDDIIPRSTQSEPFDVANITLDKLSDIKNNTDKIATLMSPFLSFDESLVKASTEKKYEILICDWLNIVRTALLKLIDANDWFFSTTHDGIEESFSSDAHPSFLNYLEKTYYTRGTLNITKMEQYFETFDENL
ncbi:helix-turn-helix domain-containing protein [Butyrivibrio sp. AE3009]|uniref:helix-turn-helix domain-containing protein n=1 Tax=Butyrivibrio sp. AE3009 TaxID=1280666 RepID=UPI0003B5253E|nr:helix-turn-helix transcriptional regulator [Butyrivibrio sp. AE3009]